MPRELKSDTAAEQMGDFVVDVLEDLKAENIQNLDVSHLTTITDRMIVASGRSDRHVRAIAEALLERCGARGIVPIGVEGQDGGEWVLVDLGDVIVHVMLPRTREFYDLEKLWDIARPKGEMAGS